MDYVPKTMPSYLDESKVGSKVDQRPTLVYQSGSLKGQPVTIAAKFIDGILFIRDTQISDVSYDAIVQFSRDLQWWLNEPKNKEIADLITEETIRKNPCLSSEDIKQISTIIVNHWIRESNCLLAKQQEPKWIAEAITEESSLLTANGGEALKCLELKVRGDLLHSHEKRKIAKKVVDMAGVLLAKSKSGDVNWKLASRFQSILKKFRRRTCCESDL